MANIIIEDNPHPILDNCSLPLINCITNYSIAQDSFADRLRYKNNGKAINLIFYESEDKAEIGRALIAFIERIRGEVK